MFCRRYNILMEPDMTRTWQSLIIDALFIDVDYCYVYQRKRNDLICQVKKSLTQYCLQKSCARKIAVLSRATDHCDSINNSVYYTRLESLE